MPIIDDGDEKNFETNREKSNAQRSASEPAPPLPVATHRCCTVCILTRHTSVFLVAIIFSWRKAAIAPLLAFGSRSSRSLPFSALVVPLMQRWSLSLFALHCSVHKRFTRLRANATCITCMIHWLCSRIGESVALKRRVVCRSPLLEDRGTCQVGENRSVNSAECEYNSSRRVRGPRATVSALQTIPPDSDSGNRYPRQQSSRAEQNLCR